MALPLFQGVDPGIVHTGCVQLEVDPIARAMWVEHEVVLGTNSKAVGNWCKPLPTLRPKTWIEGYRRRHNFGNDPKMLAAVSELKTAMPWATVLDNTGVKKVVKQRLMELLGLWDFATPTHHQDLRSAARIMVYGMLKDEGFNLLIADIVRDHLRGHDWSVVHR